MLRKYNQNRSFKDNLSLGALTAFTAGMVNVASLILFFSFTSNVTGHYAILAEEVASGKWFQVLVVISWIMLYMIGAFTSNFIIIHGRHRFSMLSHSLPLLIELTILLSVGFYGRNFYEETLIETEILTAILLFSMGVQNGLTASISNFAVKTTHLTGLTTDLGIHLSLISKKKYRSNKGIKQKLKLMFAFSSSYLSGGILAGSITIYFQFTVFYFISLIIVFILIYEIFKIRFLISKIKRIRRKHHEKIKYNIHKVEVDEF